MNDPGLEHFLHGYLGVIFRAIWEPQKISNLSVVYQLWQMLDNKFDIGKCNLQRIGRGLGGAESGMVCRFREHVTCAEHFFKLERPEKRYRYWTFRCRAWQMMFLPDFLGN